MALAYLSGQYTMATIERYVSKFFGADNMVFVFHNKRGIYMSETMKIVIAVIGVFVAGFVMVGISKEPPTTAQMEAAATIRNYVAIQSMASEKCPEAIKKATGEQVFFPTETKSDKETYITLIWLGEDAKTGGFKKASCTLHAALGGISELIIDDKVIIKKNI